MDVRSHSEFGWLKPLRSYDRVLHVLGNSRFHVNALRYLLEARGPVLLHDVRLTGLYIAATENGSGDFTPFRHKVAELYGGRIPRLALHRLPDVAVEEQYGVFMTQEVQAHTELLMTHSHHALDLLELERGKSIPQPREEVVPHGVSEPPVDGREKVSEGPLIVSYGHLAMIKGPDTILRAFAQLADERASARMLFVGHTTEYDGRYVTELARELGIADKFELRGHVDSEEYWRILLAADVAVQLRTWSNGEASGAVIDCIAARVPTIVSDIGWFGELPEGAALKVPREASAAAVAERIAAVLDDAASRDEIRAAQGDYVEANSYPRVARRYSELLGL